ncbi:hypothetical protein C7S14_6797 [Burkholderia cepacia]|nr:hypothetical protein C7S14_6797 [Burkholderia cepacia]
MLVFVTRFGAPRRSDDTTAGIVSGAGRDDARPTPGVGCRSRKWRRAG